VNVADHPDGARMGKGHAEFKVPEGSFETVVAIEVQVVEPTQTGQRAGKLLVKAAGQQLGLAFYPFKSFFRHLGGLFASLQGDKFCMRRRCRLVDGGDPQGSAHLEHGRRMSETDDVKEPATKQGRGGYFFCQVGNGPLPAFQYRRPGAEILHLQGTEVPDHFPAERFGFGEHVEMAPVLQHRIGE